MQEKLVLHLQVVPALVGLVVVVAAVVSFPIVITEPAALMAKTGFTELL